MKKRVFGAFLAFVMLFSLVPSAFAGENGLSGSRGDQSEATRAELATMLMRFAARMK